MFPKGPEQACRTEEMTDNVQDSRIQVVASMKRQMVIDFLVPSLVLAIVTILLAITDADIRLESLFYHPGSGWVHTNDDPWNFLYHYGELPGLLMGGVAVAVFFAGFFSHRAYHYRKVALYLILLLALGPGLISSAFKDYWGRPRPRQVESFGGEKRFHQVWQTGPSGEGKSFPSGHATIAFYLFSPYLALRRSSKKWAYFFLALGLVYGVLMGLARMIQGGHFPSDVLWSAGFVYFTGLILYYALRMDRDTTLQHGQ